MPFDFNNNNNHENNQKNPNTFSNIQKYRVKFAQIKPYI